MKRNLLPDNLDHLDHDRATIDKRLNELISDKTRYIPNASKGSWIVELRHVRVESTKGAPVELLRYSPDLKYHFLGPFEALYCLETSRLIIYFNEIPLSLSEAYHLLLSDRVQLTKYRVFQQLNRSGYICLTLDQTAENSEIYSTSNEILEPAIGTSTSDLHSTISSPLKDVLSTLRKNGPQDCTEEDVATILDDKLIVTFDAYKRETFAKCKPRKGKRGSPDYRVVICDGFGKVSLGCKQHLVLESGNRLERASSGGGQPSGDVLFVLVDHNTSICYAKFKSINASNLSLF